MIAKKDKTTKFHGGTDMTAAKNNNRKRAHNKFNTEMATSTI